MIPLVLRLRRLRRRGVDHGPSWFPFIYAPSSFTCESRSFISRPSSPLVAFLSFPFLFFPSLPLRPPMVMFPEAAHVLTPDLMGTSTFFLIRPLLDSGFGPLRLIV